ncbi:MAG TPA: von Willebrand factor type A domain-containing protein [Thermoanaerobaculia bacterium]
MPRPPARLAERIKADIPKYLESEPVPERITRSYAFPMRIAASFIVLIGAVIVAMTVTRTQQKVADANRMTPVIFAPASRSMAAPSEATNTVAPVARTEEVQLEIDQDAAPIVQRQIAAVEVPPAMVPPPSAASLEPQRNDESSAAGAGAESESIGVTAEAPVPEPQRTAKFAPDLTEATAQPVAAPASAPALADSALAGSAARPERRQAAAQMTEQPRQRESKKEENVFGISVDPQVFQNIRGTLASGQRPAPSAVNTEAIVNYFAGAPSRAPRGVRLEVEASPAVIPTEGEHAVLRFTIDTPAGSGVVASDARIEVVINDAAVARVERIGDAEPLARESALPAGTSVTGLYAMEMKPGLRATQLVATVRLHYTVNGKTNTITKLIEGRDLAKSWGRSSRRHRLASLGAVWAESLKGTPAGVDVAKRAQELATQEPDDVRARELARAASASAAGGR